MNNAEIERLKENAKKEETSNTNVDTSIEKEIS